MPHQRRVDESSVATYRADTAGFGTSIFGHDRTGFGDLVRCRREDFVRNGHL